MSNTQQTRMTRLVVSYDPSQIDDISRYWAENELGSDEFTAYLRKAHEEATEGDEWEEFVAKGCGVPADVTLRVERVEGGAAIDEKTAIEIRPRE